MKNEEMLNWSNNQERFYEDLTEVPFYIYLTKC